MGGHLEALGDSSLLVNTGQAEISMITSVMANFGCHLDYIWNQHKPKQQRTSVKGFLDCII